MDRWKIVTEYLDGSGRDWTLLRVRNTADRTVPAAEVAETALTETVEGLPWPTAAPPVGTVDVQLRARVYPASAIAVGELAAEQVGAVRFLGAGAHALLGLLR